MLNTIQLIGRLGADPEIKDTPNGYKVARFSLPLFHGFNREAKTTWVSCEAWNQLAEIVMLQKKGSQVYIEGELAIDSWEARNEKTGEMERRSRTYIRVRLVRFLEGMNKNSAQTPAASSAPIQNPAPSHEPQVQNSAVPLEHDVPDISTPSDMDEPGIGDSSMDDLFGDFNFSEEDK